MLLRSKILSRTLAARLTTNPETMSTIAPVSSVETKSILETTTNITMRISMPPKLFIRVMRNTGRSCLPLLDFNANLKGLIEEMILARIKPKNIKYMAPSADPNMDL